VPERPSDLPDFNRPPLVEVALGVQFEPLLQMRQGHIGLFWAEIHDEYPKTRDLQALDPAGDALDGEAPTFTLRLTDVPPLHRAWFASTDETLLVQVQSDRLIHNWRQVRGEPYPRFETLYSTFANRLAQFEAVLVRTGVPRPVPQQVEVTYINWIGTQSLAEFLLPAQAPALGLQETIGEPDEESMTFRFPVAADGEILGRLSVQASSALRRLEGKPPESGFLMSLTFRAPVLPTSELSSVENSMYRGRNAIVRVFTALTTPSWHQVWERTR
jgi:uncharacterized protein (TIGR04255 family)